ncbi:MAG: hypothetical protein RIT81_34920 [Deltaproteobacteria bacterium]
MTNLLLNRKFQLKYTGMIVGLSTIISIALGFFLVEKIRENSRMLQLDAELDAVFQEQLAQSDAKVIAYLVGALLLFNVLLGLGAIFVTHRMAGPIFVFRRYVRMLGEGRIPHVRRLRRGDEFRELIDTVQTAAEAIAVQTREEIEVLSRVQEAVAGGDAAVASDLERLIAKKRASLPED